MADKIVQGIVDKLYGDDEPVTEYERLMTNRERLSKLWLELVAEVQGLYSVGTLVDKHGTLTMPVYDADRKRVMDMMLPLEGAIEVVFGRADLLMVDDATQLVEQLKVRGLVS